MSRPRLPVRRRRLGAPSSRDHLEYWSSANHKVKGEDGRGMEGKQALGGFRVIVQGDGSGKSPEPGVTAGLGSR